MSNTYKSFFFGALITWAMFCTSSLALADVNEQQEANAISEKLPISTGDAFGGFSLEDQFHNKHELNPASQRIVISSEMEKSKEVHKWLSENDPKFLEKNNIEYIADITSMPGIITWLFARPKMQKYPFTILLANDKKFGERYPKQEGKLAVFDLDSAGKVTGINFVDQIKDVETIKADAVVSSNSAASGEAAN